MEEWLETIPLTLNVAGVVGTGAVVFLRPNGVAVAINDGTGRTKSPRALLCGYGRRNPNRYHYAALDDRGGYKITDRGRHVANCSLRAIDTDHDDSDRIAHAG